MKYSETQSSGLMGWAQFINPGFAQTRKGREWKGRRRALSNRIDGVEAREQLLGLRTHSCSSLGLPRFYSKPATYFEFLGGIGGGAETHIAKIETEIGHLHKLLVLRTLRLKKLGQKLVLRTLKLILKYGQKYRLGLWRPRVDAIKT